MTTDDAPSVEPVPRQPDTEVPAPTAMAVTTTPTGPPTRLLRVLSILVVVAGAILIVAGAVTWFVVRDQLADEKIVVSDDAERFAGDDVDGPLTAFTEADTIRKHALEASNGLTYAELDRDDPVRETVMTASFLRASLFTSVVSFGVAAFAVGIGVLMIIIGYILLRLSKLVATAPGSLAPAT